MCWICCLFSRCLRQKFVCLQKLNIRERSYKLSTSNVWWTRNKYVKRDSYCSACSVFLDTLGLVYNRNKLFDDCGEKLWIRRGFILHRKYKTDSEFFLVRSKASIDIDSLMSFELITKHINVQKQDPRSNLEQWQKSVEIITCFRSRHESLSVTRGHHSDRFSINAKPKGNFWQNRSAYFCISWYDYLYFLNIF